MGAIYAVSTEFPENYASQEEIMREISSLWSDKKSYVEQFHQSSMVKGRHLAIDLENYKNLTDIGERFQIWLEVVTKLQEKNINKLLKKVGLLPRDISLIATTTVTGISIPTLEARLMNCMAFSDKTKRLPIFGLGCLGGVAGINRVNDYLKGHPKEAALLLASELCSLTFQFDDKSVANLVGTSLFGDGVAAVLMVGHEHPLYKKSEFEILDSESFFYENSENVMGWEINANGFKIVLSGDVPKIVEKNVKPNLEYFLSKNKLTNSDVNFMVSHPGGPKVLDKICEISGKEKSDFRLSWESLAEKGNMSSVSVLHVLEKTIEQRHSTNETGLMVAMGPAFCSEMALIKKM